MANGRVQAPELRGNLALRPTPIKSDTFAAPAQPPQNDTFAALARSLAAFSSSIGDLAAVQGHKTEEERQRELDREMGRIYGLSHTEQNALSAAGKIPVYEEPFKNAAIRKVFGNTAGQTFVDDLRQEMETGGFNWDDGDADAHVTNRANSALGASPYGKDPHFTAAFWPRVNALRSQVETFAKERKTAQFVEDQTQAAFEYVDATIRHEAEGGADPEAVARNIFAQLPHLGKEGTLGLDKEKVESILMNSARRIAGEHPEIALAIVHHPRMGRDGLERSFATDRDKQEEVLNIRAIARQAISSQAEARHTKEMADRDVEAFRAGEAYRITDDTYTAPDGRQVVTSRDARLRAVRSEYGRISSTLSAARQETQQERFFREVGDYRRNGMKHPQGEAAVSGIADAASVDLLGNPEAKAKFLGRMSVARLLRQDNANTLAVYGSDKDLDFIDTFSAALDFLGKNDDEALAFAVNGIAARKEAGRETLAKYQDQINRQMGSLSTVKGLLGIEWDADPNNYSMVRAKVSQLAEHLMLSGMKAEDAVEVAGESVKKRATVHNGTVLFLQGLAIPENFAEVADEAIAEIIQHHPEAAERSGIAVEDITLYPLGGTQSGGRFLLVDKDNVSTALKDGEGRIAVLTLADLQRTANTMTEAKAEEGRLAIRQEVFEHSARQKGLVYARDKDGSLNWVDPTTREVYAFHFTEKDAAPRWKKTGKRYGRGIVVGEDGGAVLKGYEAGRDFGRRKGPALRKHREAMKQWENDIDRAAEERRKFFSEWFPRVKIGNTIINE